ncbi:MAG: phosphoribosylglycinamide formyltransferase [Bryobacteraceae bacterium]
MKRLGILLSGRGSNFQAIAASIQSGRLDADIAAVVSNREEAQGLEIARKLGLHAIALPSRRIRPHRVRPASSGDPRRRESRSRVLSGLSQAALPGFIPAYPQRILNIHPSWLPAFPGLDAQYQALTYGVKISGCTVHFVDEHLDSGPIILQSSVPVLEGDTPETLAARILVEEHQIYTEAVQIILSGEYRIEGRRVILKPD